MLKIWGRNNSVNVQKVLWCCEEMGLKYERIDAGGQFGVVNTPQYRALNPNGLVPTIEDGPFVLWESNSIVRYLTAKHSAGKALARGARRRARWPTSGWTVRSPRSGRRSGRCSGISCAPRSTSATRRRWRSRA